MRLPIPLLPLCLAFAASLAWANPDPSEKDAIALVEKGAAFMKAKGKDEMIKRLSTRESEFVQGSLYLYMRDLKSGVLLAHPINPTIVGKDLKEVPDTNGKQYRLEIMALAKKQGKGWVDYTYKNPANGMIEPKTTYILRVDDVILEAGIYKK
jgi:cytochrome c